MQTKYDDHRIFNLEASATLFYSSADEIVQNNTDSLMAAQRPDHLRAIFAIP